MAFNLGAFIGGASKQIVSDIEREEEYALKMKQISETEAMRQRSARASERRKEQLVAEEMASRLSLYYNPKQVSEIMGKGLGAAQELVTMSSELASKGFDPKPLYNFSSDADMSEEETAELVSAVAATPNISTGVPSTVEATSEVSQETDLEATGADSAVTGTINLEYYTTSMKPADDEQATLDAAYSIAIQKSLTGKTQAIREKNSKYAESLLEQIKKKDAALKGDDDAEDSSPFSKSSIENMFKTQMKLALDANEFSTDQEGRLSQKIGDRVPEYNVAVIQANTNIRLLNMGEDNAPMSLQVNALTKSNVQNAIKKIQLHARKQNTDTDGAGGITDRRVNADSPFARYSSGTDGSKVDMLQQNAKRGKYKIGDIVYTTTVQNGATITRMHVYTGVSLSKQHNNFIDAGKI